MQCEEETTRMEKERSAVEARFSEDTGENAEHCRVE